MDGAHAAFAFTSGMAALSCMTRLVKAGDEIICNADIYGGMYRLLTKVATRQGGEQRLYAQTHAHLMIAGRAQGSWSSADVVVHSATKFFGGHADVMSGFVCCKTEELSKQIYFHQVRPGAGEVTEQALENREGKQEDEEGEGEDEDEGF
eukprot:752091-Hanusia_phi.AAC.2